MSRDRIRLAYLLKELSCPASMAADSVACITDWMLWRVLDEMEFAESGGPLNPTAFYAEAALLQIQIQNLEMP